MVDFRKWFLAFAVVALVLGAGATAYAQPNPAFTCTSNAANPPIVRAEGITELVGDLVLNCTGGTPTLPGQPIPLSNVQIFLNTQITSRIVGAGNLSEALLLIDEPNAGAAAVPGPAVQAPPAGSPPQRLCTITGVGNACPETGTGGTPSPYQAQPNVFQGRQNGASQVVFLGVPIDAPGTNGTRVIRITNVRGNVCNLSGGAGNTFIPAQLVMFIAVNGTQQVTINNPQQTVGFVQPGLIVGGTTNNLLQCNNNNTGLISSSGDRTSTFNITLREGFASSFKRRNYALAPDVNTSPTPVAQNVPGFPYNTESGFYAPALTGIAGLADFGTRIRISFNNINAGTSVFVPTVIPLIANGGPSAPPPPVGLPGNPTSSVTTGILRLVNTDQFGNSAPGFTAASATGTFTPSGASAPITTSSATAGFAVYEVLNSDPNAIESATIPVAVAFISNTGQNLPAVGQSTVNVSFAPVGGPLAGIQTADANAPIPRFCDNSTARNDFAINACSCNLLFPFVTNQAGFDTGIAIANTSLDPFGTSTQSGTVTLNYFGFTTGGGAAPAAFTTTSAVPAGQELVFNLSSGGNFGVAPTPGFQGYIIATARFQYCHAFAFISDLGAQRLAEGYLAIQLDIPALNRTNQLGENEGH